MARRSVLWSLGLLISIGWMFDRAIAGPDDVPGVEGQTSTAYDAVVGDDSKNGNLSNHGNLNVELIRERYPNRSVKIERLVIQDAQDNYVNHGKWKMWDPSANLIAQGQFSHGERSGTWSRWYRGNESKLFLQKPYTQFRSPYVSQATFRDGKLDGLWTIYDSKQHKISEWGYVNDMRHGKWVWWYANGRKMREIDYQDGDMDGEVRDWNLDGKLVTKDTYQEGRKLGRKVDFHKGTQKKSEGTYLYARIYPESQDDWWNCHLSRFSKQGKDEKHGSWTSWYPSSQIKQQGEYEHDVQVGEFNWWHPNGQKAAEGHHESGEKADTWTWWHENGQKSIQGQYGNGAPSGRWMWWQEDGKVAQKADFSQSKGKVVDVPLPQNGPFPPHRSAKRGRRLEKR